MMIAAIAQHTIVYMFNIIHASMWLRHSWKNQKESKNFGFIVFPTYPRYNITYIYVIAYIGIENRGKVLSHESLMLPLSSSNKIPHSLAHLVEYIINIFRSSPTIRLEFVYPVMRRRVNPRTKRISLYRDL